MNRDHSVVFETASKYCISDSCWLWGLLHFVLQGQSCLLLQVSLDFLLLHFNPLWWIGHLFWVLVLGGLVGLHRTIQLQLIQHQWLGHRLGLLWCWMVCLGNELRSLSFLKLHASTAFHGEGNGTPLQSSCLENPMDGGAWWAAVHGVAKSWIRLSDFTFTFMHWRRKWQPTPVFMPGESQGRRSLVGCSPWGR